MFLDRCIENNPKLIEYAFKAHQEGLILPDTYILDLDTIKENATKMLEVAKANGIELFFMLKQIGRNPEVAKMLMDIGFKGAVVVDFKEALVMIDNGIHIANVGHLVQTPRHALKKIIASKPDYMTVYSIDKIKEVNEVAKELGIIQKLLIRITDGLHHQRHVILLINSSDRAMRNTLATLNTWTLIERKVCSRTHSS